MNLSHLNTPGVYINEQNTFSSSIEPVGTSIPAFIGYTPQAMYDGKSYYNVAAKISSFADFQAIYCYPDPAPPASPAVQYSPAYYLVKQKEKPASQEYMVINGDYYAFLPDPNTIYYLYNSIRLFYENGGAEAYIVAVGTYGAPSKQPMAFGAQIVNPNVKLSELEAGLALLSNEQEPTMYICPEATLLTLGDNATLMQNMLAQNQKMQTAISIFDIIGGRSPDPLKYDNDIANFRTNTGQQGLSYGTAYYPFVGTTIMQSDEINYSNLFGGDLKSLESLLNSPANPNPIVATILNLIANPGDSSLTTLQYHSALMAARRDYAAIVRKVQITANVLPTSGAMAGVMTLIDSQVGVWQAPANTSMVSVISLPIILSDSQQTNLNMDAVSGKSINVIRFFNGVGILIWGARTLDGNSQDWRYLAIRRTVIMIERSCKLILNLFVFQPNVKSTWEGVKMQINSLLTTIWKEGGLFGALPSDAFSVDCGLGTTMTSADILNGFMNVTIKVAIARPAEFIVITLQQEMATSS